LFISNEILQTVSKNVPYEGNVPNVNLAIEKPKPRLEVIDTNNFTNIAITQGTFALWFAFRNVHSTGAGVYYSLDDNSYTKMFDVYNTSITGQVVLHEAKNVNTNLTDEASKITIALNNKNTLISVGDEELWSHLNLCLVDQELLAFKNAKKNLKNVQI
jgi:hypothetical protein